MHQSRQIFEGITFLKSLYSNHRFQQGAKYRRILQFSTFLSDLQLNLANSSRGPWRLLLNQKIEMKTLVMNFQNVSINNLNLQNFIIESTNRRDRICRLCSLGAVEDEDHLLLVCPAHHDIRCKFSQQLGKQLTPCSLLPELMHSANQKAVALYLVSCLDNRSVLLKSTL